MFEVAIGARATSAQRTAAHDLAPPRQSPQVVRMTLTPSAFPTATNSYPP